MRSELLAAPDVVAFLRAWAAAMRAADPGFSLRRLARAVGEANETLMHSVVQGGRRLTLAQAARWVPVMDLSAPEQALFLALVEREQAAAELRRWQRRSRPEAGEDGRARLRLAAEAAERAELALTRLLGRGRPRAFGDAPTSLVYGLGPDGDRGRDAVLAASQRRGRVLHALSGRREGSAPLLYGLTEAVNPLLVAEIRSELARARDRLLSAGGAGGEWTVCLSLFPLSVVLGAGAPPAAPTSLAAPSLEDAPSVLSWAAPEGEGVKGFLRAWLSWRRRGEPTYGYAAFARDAGQSDRAILWKILNDRLRLTPLRARALAQGDLGPAHPGLGLDDDETELLALLAARDLASDPAERRLHQARIDQQIALSSASLLPTRRARTLAGWAPYAIHELAGCVGFDPSPDWIADALMGRVGPDEVRTALDMLFSARMLTSLPEGLRPTAARWQVERPATATAPEEAILRYHRAMAALEEQALRGWTKEAPDPMTTAYILRISAEEGALRGRLAELYERVQAVCAGAGARTQVAQVCLHAWEEGGGV